MQYLSRNYRSKAEVKRAIAAGTKISVRVVEPQMGNTTVCGPWYPEPHKWYGTVVLDDQGYVTKIK